jgi:hypothetical protein
MMDDDQYGAVGGMGYDKGNRSISSKPTPMPICPSHIPPSIECGLQGGKPGTGRLSRYTELSLTCKVQVEVGRLCGLVFKVSG